MSKQKTIILTTVFVDVLGFGIVIPILPFYLNEFGASAFTITLLFSIFSFCAFLSAPLLGAMSDRIGRRPVLLLSIFSTSIGWFVFASAASIPFLFLGRMIDGLAAGNFTTAQSYLIDISKDEKERVTNLGIIGATFGIGFILGPLVGGILSTVSHAFPFYAAGTMALINGIVAFFVLEESNHSRNTTKLTYNPIRPLVTAYRSHSIRALYFIWFLFCMSFVIVQSIFALFAQQVFGFGSFETGIFFTTIGVIIAVNQLVLLNKFWTKRFSEKQLETIMLSFVIVGLLSMATEKIALYYISFLLIGTSQAIMRIVMSNQAISKADPIKKGEIMGIMASMMTAAMVIGPILGGYLFEMKTWLPFIAGAFFSSCALIVSRKSK
ncbi:MAG: MFS transporter [Ignavibacteriales bacterium]|nr:MFS transporter [Ignavibacteriales bacterium]